MKIILATTNKGKLAEIRNILASVDIEIISLTDLPPVEFPEETGATFRENAIIKARFIADRFGLAAIADDSGLEVDALGGLPGVRSARYAGEGAIDEANYQKLLLDMADVPMGRRSARFRCVIALVIPEGETWTFEDTLEGEIALTPAGKNGFGYDPVFFIPSKGRTSAELTPDEKNTISHRGKALEKLKTWFDDGVFLGGPNEPPDPRRLARVPRPLSGG